jgi:2-haloacid dehalogenase
MDFSRFTAISFDCYGTLIEWEAGILPAIRNLFARHKRQLADSAILELYGEFEAAAEAGPYISYKEVLQTVVRAFAERLRFEPGASDILALSDSVPGWPAFPDTLSALRCLKQRYKLAVISNIDDDLFARTRAEQLAAFDFHAVITAEQARSYKPSLNNFHLALRALAIEPDRLLHVGQSIYHDVLPAKSLGMATVWVNRRSARPGIGAVRAAAGQPDLEVPDLATLAAMAAA